MKYILDANVFIEASNRTYKPHIFPCFWEWLLTQNQDGNLCSIDQVYIELTEDKEDKISSWVKNQKGFFLPCEDEATQNNFAEHVLNGIEEYIPVGYSHQRKSTLEAHKDRFLSKADPWVIAKAMTLGAVIIIHETKVEDNSYKIKIPNIAKQFNLS